MLIGRWCTVPRLEDKARTPRRARRKSWEGSSSAGKMVLHPGLYAGQFSSEGIWVCRLGSRGYTAHQERTTKIKSVLFHQLAFSSLSLHAAAQSYLSNPWSKVCIHAYLLFFLLTDDIELCNVLLIMFIEYQIQVGELGWLVCLQRGLWKRVVVGE